MSRTVAARSREAGLKQVAISAARWRAVAAAAVSRLWPAPPASTPTSHCTPRGISSRSACVPTANSAVPRSRCRVNPPSVLMVLQGSPEHRAALRLFGPVRLGLGCLGLGCLGLGCLGLGQLLGGFLHGLGNQERLVL